MRGQIEVEQTGTRIAKSGMKGHSPVGTTALARGRADGSVKTTGTELALEKSVELRHCISAHFPSRKLAKYLGVLLARFDCAVAVVALLGLSGRSSALGLPRSGSLLSRRLGRRLLRDRLGVLLKETSVLARGRTLP